MDVEILTEVAEEAGRIEEADDPIILTPHIIPKVQVADSTPITKEELEEAGLIINTIQEVIMIKEINQTMV